MKYLVSGYLTISVRKVIEAYDEDAARAAAEDLAAPSLCHQCSSAGGDGEWELNDFDDPPEDCIQDISET